MNIKKVIITLSLFLLLSCGYDPIYSKKKIDNNYNFSIDTINLVGDDKVNQLLKKNLKKNLTKEKKTAELSLNLNTAVVKSVTSKDKKGNPKRYSIKISINLEIYENEILKGTASFEENFEYNNKSNKFDLKQYEKNIKENLVSKLSNEIMRYLSSLK